ncbi:MAG TPA: pilus assembly protein PilM, partial [Planctomycetota bacterium]|nr:pilus assembly protein PilM [Planctomycetota bacterium]
EVVWDYQVSPSGSGGESTVSLVAIRKEIVDRLLESLREFNLNVVGLAPSPVAVLNYVSYDLGPAETSLILDAGAKVTDFVILHGNSFWFRPLPIAGEDITHVFEQKFRMPHAEAEGLKLKIGESKQAEKMFQVVEPTLRSLAGEIQRTAGYYKSLSRDVRIGRVFGIGHTFALPGLVEFLSRNIEMDVELVSAPQRVSVSPAVDTTWFAEEFPGMGAALGLALQALGLARIKMSLLPKALVKEQQAGVRRYFYGAVAAAIVGAVTCLGLHTQGASKEVDEQIEKMCQRFNDVAKQQNEVDAKDKASKPRREQLQRWSKIGAERGQYSEVLEKLLKAVDTHNRGLTVVPPPAALNQGDAFPEHREGEVVLAAFYMSWENPLVALTSRPEMDFPQERELQSAQARKAKRMYVAAKFECRGDSFENFNRFEGVLKGVPGFQTVMSDAKARWVVGGPPKQVKLSFFDWGTKSDRQTNALTFWAVWQFVPDAPVSAAAAGGKTREAAAGAGSVNP